MGFCEYKYKFGDFHLDQSCRCKRECTGGGYDSCKPAPTDHDCNGDGEDDCGRWDYDLAACGSGHRCSYQYSFGDTLLDHSCRCKPECQGDSFDSCQPEVTDYDCNGDGERDCGIWDYGRAACDKLSLCQYKYKGGDGLLDQSCRCQECAKDDDPTSAAADRNLVPEPSQSIVGRTEYWARWQTWADHIQTCAPWMMPTNDADLVKLLEYARERNYWVRPSGAGHSAGGLVNDGEDKRVMVVSLGAYQAPSDWEFQFSKADKLVRINAGWSQLDLYRRIRPEGFFMHTQTAGYFFQMAGIMANTVHGATYSKSFLHSYVTRMRVMLHDGTIKIVSGDDLKYWRNSYGLLGLILGIELRLVENQKFQMYTKTRQMDRWSEEEYWRFIMQDAEANIPASVASGKASAGTRKASAGEFFIDMLPDRPSMIVYANKENDNANEPGFATGIPSNIASNYEEVASQKVTKFEHNGEVRYDESVRKEGCPALYLDPFELIRVDKLIGNKLIEILARVIDPLRFAAQTLTQLPSLVGAQRDSSNDGFFAVKAPNTLIAAYFIRPELSFQAMDYMRTKMRQRNEESDWTKADGFSWNQPAEFRFVTVTDDAVLQPVPPGLWFVSEILSFPDSGATDQAWKEAFEEVEDYWINELGAVPHIGKLFGFHKDENDHFDIFHQSKVCQVYSAATKDDFNAYREQMDPPGLFNYGLGEKLLRSC